MCITEYDKEKFFNMLKKEAQENGYKKALEGIAKKMKEDGYPESKIEKYTGLDPQIIEEL